MKIDVNSLVKESNVKKVPYVPSGVHKNTNKDNLYLLLPKEPIEVTIKDKVYRVLPMFKDVGISADGEIINLHTLDTVKCVKKEEDELSASSFGQYRHVSLKDYRSGKPSTAYLHRLVAMAWVDNDDYVKKNVVDHIDNDKFNNKAENLRWVTPGENTALAVHGELGKYTVLNMKTQKKILCDSLRKAAEIIGIDYRNLSTKRLPLLTTREGIEYFVYETNMGDKALQSYFDNKYPFKVVDTKTGEVEYFKTKDDIYKRYSIPGWYKTIKVAHDYLIGKGLSLIDTINVSVTNKYDVKNIKTGEEYLNNTLKEVIEITGIPRSTVLSRINRKYKYGLPMGDYVLKFNNEPEYEPYKVNKKVSYKLVDENKTFDSKRALARYLGVDRKTIKSVSDTELTYKGRKILIT